MKGSTVLPRTRVVRAMRKMRRDSKTILDMWKVTSTIHVPDDSPSGGTWVPRPADQYPENQELAWESLYNRAEGLALLAREVMTLASTEYHALRAQREKEASK